MQGLGVQVSVTLFFLCDHDLYDLYILSYGSCWFLAERVRQCATWRSTENASITVHIF